MIRLPDGVIKVISDASGISCGSVSRYLSGYRKRMRPSTANRLANACRNLGIDTDPHDWERIGGTYLKIREAIARDFNAAANNLPAPYHHAHEKLPERYYNCAHYEECLKDAAYKSAVFGCEGCVSYQPIRVPMDRDQAWNYNALIYAVITGDVGAARRQFLGGAEEERGPNSVGNINLSVSNDLTRNLRDLGWTLERFCRNAGFNPSTANNWIGRHHRGEPVSKDGAAFIDRLITFIQREAS